jgi:hypothetical protein
MAYSDDSELRGVGGWLGLLVFGMLVGAPLSLLAGAAGTIGSAEQANPALATLPVWQQVTWLIWGFSLAQAAIHATGAWRLITRQVPQTVRFAIGALWIGGPLLNVIGNLTIDTVAGVSPVDDLLGSLRSFAYAGVWTAYLLKSQRVKNTYQDSYAEVFAG